jgi:hypothetical protein
MTTLRIFAIGMLSIALSGCVLVVATDRDEETKANDGEVTKNVRVKVAATTLDGEMTKCPAGTTTVTEDVSQENGKTMTTLVCTKTGVKTSVDKSSSKAELLQALVTARSKLASDTNLSAPSRQRVLDALDEQISQLAVKDQK